MKKFLLTPFDPRTKRSKRAARLDEAGDYESSKGLGQSWFEDTVRAKSHEEAAIRGAAIQHQESSDFFSRETYWVRPETEPSDVRKIVVRRKIMLTAETVRGGR